MPIYKDDVPVAELYWRIDRQYLRTWRGAFGKKSTEYKTTRIGKLTIFPILGPLDISNLSDAHTAKRYARMVVEYGYENLIRYEYKKDTFTKNDIVIGWTHPTFVSEVNEWCKKHMRDTPVLNAMKKQVSPLYKTTCIYEVVFSCEEDALMFKLKWL
jgi:hypothetical protein